MTESDWLTATSPQSMLEFLRDSGKLTERKARLFAVACCRRIWPLLTDPRSRAAVEMAEGYADGNATQMELSDSCDTAFDVEATFAESMDARQNKLRWAAWAASGTALPDEFADVVALQSATASGAQEKEERAHAALLHCIFGNPFRPQPSIDASVLAWNDGTVRRIAARIYEERDWSLMPVLADALEDAGSKDASILEHLRGASPHGRGCFALDAILGKH